MYEGLGDLVGVDLPDGRSIDYVLDGTGRRMHKRIDGTPVAGWLYQDAVNPIAELDASGAVVRRFVYGSRSFVPDYAITAGDVVHRLITDERGSVRLVVRETDGAIVQRIDYDPFGAIIAVTGDPSIQPFGFAGGLHDHDTGLVHSAARDYDPTTGRWLQADMRPPTPARGLGEPQTLRAFSFPIRRDRCTPDRFWPASFRSLPANWPVRCQQ